jgi:hypothetical protein
MRSGSRYGQRFANFQARRIPSAYKIAMVAGTTPTRC